MDEQIAFQLGVTLAGGGPASAEDLRAALSLAPHAVAADGGADRLTAHGVVPEAIIGDMDSLRGPVPEGARLIPVAEQDTTDFAKCLARIDAPVVVGVGFLGGRLDHTLAALSVLLQHAGRCIILLGEEDIAFIAPSGRAVEVSTGTRVSFFPLVPCRGVSSTGLRWPIEGLAMAASAQIGTSNESVAPRVSSRFEPPGAVTILPKRCLRAAVESFGPLPVSGSSRPGSPAG